MRRTLLALAAAASIAALAPTPASASHACAPGFEILCTNVCWSKPILGQNCLHQ
jgi:hypothetical protein